MPQSHTLQLCMASLCLVLWSALAYPATWTTEAVFTVERTTEVNAEGTTHEDQLDQSYTLTYETNLLESLEFTLDFALDITETDQTPGYGTREVKPSVEVGLVAQWWDLLASWDETKTTDRDPAVGRTVESTWEFEAVVEPEYEALPAFRYNIQGGNDDVTDKDTELVFEYTFLDKLDATLGFSRETSDVPEPDEDTDGRTIEAEINLTHEFTKTISFEADWKSDRDQVLTLTDQGEILQREDLLSNDVRTLLEWDVLDMLLLSLEKEVQWDADLEQGTLEVTDTWVWDAEFDHDLTQALHLNLAYNDDREDARPVGPHTYTITRDSTAELEFGPFEWLTVTPSFDRSDKTQWSREPGSETDTTLDDTYEILLEYSLWGEFLVLDVTRTWEFSWEKGSKTKKLRSWDVGLEALPLYVPNLEIVPTYSFTEDVDTVADTADEEKTVEVDIGYTIGLGDRLVLTLDHTYSRTQTWKNAATENSMTIDRADDTDLVLTWDQFLRGMVAELSLTRAAKDTSGDDKEPEIDYTYSATYDWEMLAGYTFGFEYNRDVKQESEDTQDFTTTVSVEFYSGRITLDFEHEFDEQLEGERTKTHRYLIELHGEF
ncbi:MAG: hypothetical protein P1P84_23735 [Deferrisomatales bacterium]|nr:hypothetical protein [Deferrisomatales bacterium]